LLLSILSVVIAFTSLLVVVYKEFLQSFKLSSHFGQIFIARLPEGNRQRIIKNYFVNLFISGSEQEKQAALNTFDPENFQRLPELKEAIESKDKDRLQAILNKGKI